MCVYIMYMHACMYMYILRITHTFKKRKKKEYYSFRGTLIFLL